jgi:hypothetical protein
VTGCGAPRATRVAARENAEGPHPARESAGPCQGWAALSSAFPLSKSGGRPRSPMGGESRGELWPVWLKRLRGPQDHHAADVLHFYWMSRRRGPCSRRSAVAMPSSSMRGLSRKNGSVPSSGVIRARLPSVRPRRGRCRSRGRKSTVHRCLETTERFPQAPTPVPCFTQSPQRSPAPSPAASAP